jgi:hypothetical protein
LQAEREANPIEFMISPENQTKSNERKTSRCSIDKHATWSMDLGFWIYSKTAQCGPYGCDKGIPFTSPKARRNQISKAVAEELMPSLIALDETKERLCERFSCTAAQLLAIHAETIIERSKLR